MKNVLGITGFVCLALIVAASAGAAETERPAVIKMVNGAGTLPKGTPAISINAGVDLTEPVPVSLRFDYGVTDRLQMGASVSGYPLVFTATLHDTFNLVKSSDGMHFLSLEFDVGYLYVDSGFSGFAGIEPIKSLTLRPALAYEARLGEERRTGIFFKAGSLDVRANQVVTWGRALGEGTGQWANVARLTLGVQHQFGNHFALTAQGSLHAPSPFFLGQVGLTWAF